MPSLRVSSKDFGRGKKRSFRFNGKSLIQEKYGIDIDIDRRKEKDRKSIDIFRLERKQKLDVSQRTHSKLFIILL